MEWINFAFEHSTATIIFLVLCLLVFNFGSVMWLVIIGILIFIASQFL